MFRLLGILAVLWTGLLRAQDCFPLVPPPPPPPDATREMLEAWPSVQWAGQHQMAVLRALFSEDDASGQGSSARVLIRGFPAFAPPYQLEVIIPDTGPWILRGWFLAYNLEGRISELKQTHPAIDEAGIIKALQFRPVQIAVDPHAPHWRWLSQIRPGMIPLLKPTDPGVFDDDLICWAEQGPGCLATPAKLFRQRELGELAVPIHRLSRLLMAVQR